MSGLKRMVFINGFVEDLFDFATNAARAGDYSFDIGQAGSATSLRVTCDCTSRRGGRLIVFDTLAH